MNTMAATRMNVRKLSTQLNRERPRVSVDVLVATVRAFKPNGRGAATWGSASSQSVQFGSANHEGSKENTTFSFAASTSLGLSLRMIVMSWAPQSPKSSQSNVPMMPSNVSSLSSSRSA